MTETKENYFNTLSKIAGETEQKGNLKLTYMSWAVAWNELKKVYPRSNYKVHENVNGMPYFSDETGGFVKVTVNVIMDEKNNMDASLFRELYSHTVYLPIMDHSNRAIKKESINTMEINKAIQRALTKAIAMHGLGLYLYRGEDYPDDDTEQKTTVAKDFFKKAEPKTDKPKEPEKAQSYGKDIPVPSICSQCDVKITEKVRDYSIGKFGNTLCFDCQKTYKKREEEPQPQEEHYDED